MPKGVTEATLGKRPPGKAKRRWENNIEIDLQEGCWGGTDCVNLVQYRESWRPFVDEIMNVLAP